MKLRILKNLPPLLVLSFSLLGASSSTATDIVWGTNLGAGPWVWNTGSNWTGGTAPIVNTDRGDLRKDWTAAATINLGAATTVNGILFDDTGAASDVGVTLGNGGTAGNTLTLAGTTPAVDVIGSLTVSAGLAGNTGFSKTGAGTLALTNANAGYTGATVVSAGVLQVGAFTANATFVNNLGASVTVKNAAILDYPLLHASTTQTANYTGTTPITVEDGGKIRVRASTGSSIYNISSPVTVAGNTTIENNGGGYESDVNFSAKFSGSGTLTYAASTNSGNAVGVYRTLKLSSTATDFTGNWFIDYTVASADDFAELASGGAGALGTGSVSLDDRAVLTNTVANGLNSLSGVSTLKSTSSVNLGNFPWVNPSATLAMTGGTLELGSGASSIGTLTLNASAAVNGTGTLGFTSAILKAGTLSGGGILVPAASATLGNTGATAAATVSAPINLANSGTTATVTDFTANPNADLILSGVISGANGLTKDGAGTLQLGGANTFAGPLNILGGDVLFNSTTAPAGVIGGLAGTGPINIKGTAPATLSGPSSTYTGTVNVEDGATLAGEADTAGTLILGTTTGAKLQPDTSTPTAAFTASNITLNGVTRVVFPATPAPGTYTLLKYTGALSGTAVNLSADFRGSVLNMGSGTNSAITLTLGTPLALTWNNGAATSVWDTNGDTNWTAGAGNDRFYTSDPVTFDDTPGSSQVINISENVTPASVTFNNSAAVNYQFSGSPIIGEASLVKNGAGSVTLGSANTYTGGTALNAGTLRVGSATALSTGAVSITGGTLSNSTASALTLANPISLDGDATLGLLTDTGALTLSGPFALPASRQLTVNAPVTISSAISGIFPLTKAGSSTLTLTGANAYGSTTVDTGTLQIGAGGTAGVLPAGATINTTGTLRYFRNDTQTLANVFSGAGTLAFKGTGTSGQSSYSLTGANTLSGTVIAEAGARVGADNSAGTRFGTAVVQIQTGGQAYLSAGPSANNFSIAGNGWTESAGQLGAIRVNGTITGSVTLAAPARLATYNGNGTISGPLIGTAALEINAPAASFTGTLNYSGNGSGYTGNATVSQGTLNLTGSLGGNLAVSSTTIAGLAGEGTIAGNLSLGLGSIGANLTTDAATPGALTVTGTLTTLNTTTVNLSNIPPTGGTFPIVKHGGTTALPTNFALAGGANYRTAAVFNTTADPTTVTVQVTPGNPITWKGTTAVWDVNTTANFVSPGPVAEKFFTLDSVTFDDSATTFAPTLAVTVVPASVTINNSLNAYTLTGAGAIGGLGGLTKTGSQSATISTANTFTGNVAINGGKLVLGNAGALGAAGSKTVAVGSGGQFDFAGISPGTTRAYSYQIAGAGADGNGALTNSSATSVGSNSGVKNLELTANATIGGASRFDIGFVGTTPGLLTGNGHTLTKVGANSIQLRADASASPINILVQGGTLGAEDTDNAFGGTTGSVTAATGATLATYGVRSIATPVTLNGGSTLSNLGGGAGTWTGTVALGGDTTINPAGQVITLDGIVSGTGGITVPANGGTLNLNGANSFNGGLILGTANTTATIVNIGATSTLAVAAGKPIQVGNNAGVGGTNLQSLNVNGAATVAGTLFLGRAGTLNLNTGGSWNQSGTMAVNSQGGYNANLNVATGSTFTYSGASTVKVNGGSTGIGTISIAGLFQTSAGFEQDLVPTTGYGVVTLTGGTLKLTGNVAQLTTANRFTLGTGGGTIDTNGFNASLSYGISGAGNSLTKTGAGRLTLTGASTYTGTTSVTAGTLAGAGSATSVLTIDSGATLAPGAAIGTFNSAGATFSSGSTFAVEINSTTDTADKLVSTGDVAIAGANVSFAEIGSGIVAAGTKLVILDYTGKTLTGSFNGYTEGATVAVGANSFILNYADASRIVLTAQTVPSYDSWSLNHAGGQGADLDFDEDGVRNGVEYFMGQTGSSSTVNPNAVNGVVTWPKDPTAVATGSVQISDDLILWIPAPSGVVETSTSISYTLPAGSTKRFVRLKVVVP